MNNNATCAAECALNHTMRHAHATAAAQAPACFGRFAHVGNALIALITLTPAAPRQNLTGSVKLPSAARQ